MKNLPTHDECKLKCDKHQNSRLERFIYENEPAGNDEANLFRNQLIDVLNEHADMIGYNAWEGGRLAFAKEIGNDMSEDGPIDDHAKQFLDRERFLTEPNYK